MYPTKETSCPPHTHSKNGWPQEFTHLGGRAFLQNALHCSSISIFPLRKMNKPWFPLFALGWKAQDCPLSATRVHISTIRSGIALVKSRLYLTFWDRRPTGIELQSLLEYVIRHLSLPRKFPLPCKVTTIRAITKIIYKNKNKTNRPGKFPHHDKELPCGCIPHSRYWGTLNPSPPDIYRRNFKLYILALQILYLVASAKGTEMLRGSTHASLKDRATRNSKEKKIVPSCSRPMSNIGTETFPRLAPTGVFIIKF